MLKFLQSELYIISVSILFLEMNYHVHGTEAGTEGTGGGGTGSLQGWGEGILTNK